MISNDDVASLLEEVASLLDAQGADGFRVRAYRQGADAVRAEARPVARIVALRAGARRVLGQWHGKVRMSDDFDAPLPALEQQAWDAGEP